MPGSTVTTPTNTGSGAYGLHDFDRRLYSPTQQETLPTEAHLLRHQLHLLNSHVHQLEQRLQRRDVTISKLEAHLEHANTDAQAALKTVALLSALLNGRLPRDPADEGLEVRRIETAVRPEGCIERRPVLSSVVVGLEKKHEVNDGLEPSTKTRDISRGVPL
jgi:hypothetical protein